MPEDRKYKPELNSHDLLKEEYPGPSVLARIFTPRTSDFTITIIAQRPRSEPVRRLDDIKE